MTSSFITVDEGMILNQREGECCGFFFKGRIKVISAKGGPRLRDGRFQCA